MSSENISRIAAYPFINKFVFSIINTILQHNLHHEDRQVIDAELVPKFSVSIMQASPIEREVPATKKIPVPQVLKHQHKDMSELVAPIKRPVRDISTPFQSITPVPQKAFTISRPEGPTIARNIPKVAGGVQLSQDYGKITPLLNDPSVSSIECQEIGKPLMIIRAGQRQITRIVLNGEDIKGILQKISDTVHIPLLEGVFRAATDNFSINAVISSVVGSRFVIKKQTPYALLER